VEFGRNIPGLDAPREKPAHTCPWALFWSQLDPPAASTRVEEKHMSDYTEPFPFFISLHSFLITNVSPSLKL
jgi:hypothetical protein